MVAGARVVAGPRPRAAAVGPDRVDRLARWLLVAVALDLILTRLVVRLAIFIPKGDPWATLSAVLGRIGAATDVLVPLVGLLLLGALLLRAGRRHDRAEQALIVLIAVVAAGGLALVYLPPTPLVAIVLDLVVVAVAIGAGLGIRGQVRAPRIARLGMVSLAGAVALAATARAVDGVGVVAGLVQGSPSVVGAPVTGALGQVAFVVGAALLGLGGIVAMPPAAVRRGWLAVIGLAAALSVLAFAIRAPATWGALAIWSMGLPGGIPAPAIAIAVGLAVAGLPLLYRREPGMAVGASIIILAGYGLAASGLALAALLGLVVAQQRDHRRPRLAALDPAAAD